MRLTHEQILSAARDAGFDLCGVARCRPLDEHRSGFDRWLSDGCGSALGYMYRNADKRFNPSLLLPGARSVIVCAVSYKRGDADCGSAPKIASYACARDYHITIKNMLARMAGMLQARCPDSRWRRFTDSAPVAEKSWAVEAGLGWIGRNSLLVTPQFGPAVLLGELLTDAESDRYDQPLRHDGCGECRRCVHGCPAGAIRPGRVVDARRCISARTIEPGDDPDPQQLHGWLFGCDACIEACPCNMRAPLHSNADFDAVFNPGDISAAQWAGMSQEEFEAVAGGTPLMRAGLERIRKICAAAEKSE